MTQQTDRLNTALAGRYRIERHLGEGGMASVYLCEDLKHDRKVALKLLKPELAAVLGADRFVVEIKTTAAMQHPHILPLFDSGTADGFLSYVMPFIEGETLRDKLNRETQLGVDEAVRIAREVLDALQYAHEHGIVHRDVKPENILLHGGHAMVADFGIALAVSAAAGGRMTETGLSLGTPHYMSPEQATAEKEITGRSDVYSLASVLYEMLAGQPPHLGGSAQQIIMKIIAEPVESVTRYRKSVAPNVAAATAKALEKLPADRFQTAKAFSEALGSESFRYTPTIGHHAVAAPAHQGAAPTNWKRVAAIASIVLVAGVAVGMSLGKRGLVEPPVVRLSLMPPAGYSLATLTSPDVQFALSPDGRTVAVVAAPDSVANGARQIFVRALDQSVWTPIPGTETAATPFFSSDGKWIGFFTDGPDGPMKTVPVSGGPAVTLSERSTNRPSASWGDDNFIVYESGRGELARMSGAGGPSTIIAARRDTSRTDSGGTFWPWVPPGSKAVLAERCTVGGCLRPDLVAVDVATGSVTVVVPGATRGWYLPGGYLVYASGTGGIYAVTFDAKRLRVTGDPVSVLEGVQAAAYNGSRLGIAAATGTMAYLGGASGERKSKIVAVDRTGHERVLVAQPDVYQQPRWSPDGKRIAVGRIGKDGNQIWIYDLASTTASQLTHGNGATRQSWSPDGKRIAFSNTSGHPFLEWIPVDGSQPAEGVVEGPEATNPTTCWTADGKWIITDGLVSGATHEVVFAVPTSGKRVNEPVVQSSGDAQAGSVSPDGKWISYVSNESEGKDKVFVQPFRAQGGRFQVSIGAATEARWVSNHELTYVDAAANALILADLSLGAGVQVVKRTQLFSVADYLLTGVGSWGYDVSRDGREFVFAKPEKSGRAAQLPIVVLNWGEEIKRKASEQGGKH